MRLKYQLFVVLLLTSALSIALVAGVARWSFERGFVDYADDYARNGSWAWVTGDRRTWKALLYEHVRERRRDGLPRPPPDNGVPPRRSTSPDTAPPRPRDEPPPDGAGLLTLDPRLLLAAATRQVLIGRTRPGGGGAVRWQPIELDGNTVGFLGHRASEVQPGGIDQAFAVQQRRGLTYAALAMVILSALLAAILAARLVRPLLGLADAVQRIGRGEYAHRVPVTRADELGALARDVNRLAASLETNLEARQRWLAEISHELRTPVAILRGELEAIQDGVQRLDATAVD